MFGLGRSEIAAQLDRACVNIRHACRLAGEVHVLHLFVAGSCPDRGACSGAHICAGRTSFGDGAHVVELNLFVLERLDDDVEVRHRERRSGDLKNVRAEIGDLLFHIEVRALHDGHDRNEGGHTHRQPKHGERGSQFVSAQRADALRKIVTNGEHGAGKAFPVTLPHPAKREVRTLGGRGTLSEKNTKKGVRGLRCRLLCSAPSTKWVVRLR